jgi:hypothetical protein
MNPERMRPIGTGALYNGLSMSVSVKGPSIA